ncbi:ATP-binding protein [Planotetraspora silvatica]|uniref:ATP-binding protein n=1 Tax=Planotetraspora silvatica TaxID=234614 RepID=UPI00195239D4|nr:ATP-binding protein [Planotetraspora silvatica]
MSTDWREHWPITADLALLREQLHQHAADAGLTGERIDDLVISVNEAAINVLEHGGGSGSVSAWNDGTHLVVEVADTAGLLTPQDLRHQRPSPGATRGFGLWVMSQLCDEVAVDQESGRSRLQLRMRLPAH